MVESGRGALVLLFRCVCLRHFVCRYRRRHAQIADEGGTQYMAATSDMAKKKAARTTAVAKRPCRGRERARPRPRHPTRGPEQFLYQAGGAPRRRSAGQDSQWLRG